MTRVADVIDALERFAPPAWAEDWDPVGLAVGDREQAIDAVLLSLDLDGAAEAAATAAGAGLIVVHHPPIFSPLRQLLATRPSEARLLRLIRAGVALYCAHPTLDAPPGGVNDQLAYCLGLVPEAPLVPLSDAQLTATPWSGEGMRPGLGRLCAVPEGLDRHGLLLRINQQLQTAGCIPNFDSDGPLTRICVLGGSYDEDWLSALLEAGVDFVVAGEIKHHALVELRDHGIAAVVAGHEASERVVLHPLAGYLREALPGLRVVVHEGLDYNQLLYRES